MKKIILILLFFANLSSSEPFIAELLSVESNSILHFRYKSSSFVCTNYGVIEVDTLYRDKNISKECRKSINEFYIYNPKLKNIAHYIFEPRQLYHIEVHDDKCMIFIKGRKSYSEYLIEIGLAKVKPFFNDKRYRQTFKNAQYEAKLQKKGFWDKAMIKNCVINYEMDEINLKE